MINDIIPRSLYILGLIYGANRQETYQSHSNLNLHWRFLLIPKVIFNAQARHAIISGVNEVLRLTGARGISQD